jgi:hypothetical protein
MSNLFRIALEGEAVPATDPAPQAATEPTVELKGPLADVYARALDIAYAKEDPNADAVDNAADAGKAQSPADAATIQDPAESTVAESNNTGTTQPAFESSANDTLTAQALAATLVVPEQVQNTTLTVYGVNRNDVDEEQVVDLTKELVNQDSPEDFVLIMDATQPGPNGDGSSAPVEKMEMLSASMECIVEVFGGRVFHSLEDFKQAQASK